MKTGSCLVVAAAAALSFPGQAQTRACYQQCMDDRTQTSSWTVLETGARCSEADALQVVSREHQAAVGRLWVAIDGIDVFQGAKPPEAVIDASGRVLRVTSYCDSTSEASYRIRATDGPEDPDTDAAHRACVQECP